MTVECEIRGTCQAKADTLRGEKQSDRCNWAEGHLEVQVEDGDDIGGIRRSSSRARDNAALSATRDRINIRHQDCHRCSAFLPDVPDQDGLLDAKRARIQLHPHKPPPSRYNPLIRQQIPQRIRDEDDKVD